MAGTGNPNWKPGVSGNPGGRTKLPEGLRGVAGVTAEEIRLIISKMARMCPADLLEAIVRPGVTALEAMWAHQIVKAATKGDNRSLELIMSRLIGPAAIPDQASAPNPLAGKTQAELLDIIRKTLPAARDLPELGSSTDEVPMATGVPPSGSQSYLDPNKRD